MQIGNFELTGSYEFIRKSNKHVANNREGFSLDVWSVKLKQPLINTFTHPERSAGAETVQNIFCVIFTLIA